MTDFDDKAAMDLEDDDLVMEHALLRLDDQITEVRSDADVLH